MIYYANIQTHIVMNHSQIVTNRIFEGNLYLYHFCYIFPSATQVVHVTVLFYEIIFNEFLQNCCHPYQICLQMCYRYSSDTFSKTL